MHKVWLIVHREYLERIRSKTFLFFTLLMPALMAGSILIPAKLADLKSDTNVYANAVQMYSSGSAA